MQATAEVDWEITSRTNGRPFSRHQVGWFTVAEPREFNGCGEYAADYWSTRVEPGRYPLYAFRDCGRRWHSLGCRIPGVIASGSWWNKLQPGQPRDAHIHPYAHSVASSILNGEDTGIELLPHVEAREIHFTDSNGRESVTHGLFAGDTQF